MATTPYVWRIRDLERLLLWHSGKAVLIDDAVHAVIPRVSYQSAYFGQGCNIAVEDGEALGYFLSNLASAAQISAALESFEKIRVPRAHMVRCSSRVAKFYSNAFMATKVYEFFAGESVVEVKVYGEKNEEKF
ncbi:hypothetical protein C8R44DRAFT_753559 [Mycena epipterygia]|nr:hypothetical protein C8R44DRAFT_753559 [Mycena epipterygia]